jgi:hypothetical protein
LELARRIAAPCAVILASAVIYGFVLGVLNALRHLPRMVFLVYSYAFFYGGLFGLVLSPFLIPSVLADLAGSSEFERALFISSFIPLGLAGAAAAYVAIDAERNLAQQCVAADRADRPRSG